MRAYEIHGSFGLENLRIVPRDLPALLPGQVRVRLRAVSLNYRDLLTVQGSYNPRQSLPLIPCSDGAGEVVEIAPGVSRVRVGDRVMPIFAQRWFHGDPTADQLKSTLGGPNDGMLAEEVVLYEEGLVHVPEHLDFAQASTLPCAAVTAYSALEQCGVRAGDTVVVQGTGGVATFALQFAVHRGAKVIVTSKSDEKLARAKTMGAAQGINYAEVPEWAKQVRELTHGRGADVVIEVGGAGTFAKSVRAVRPGGAIALIGVLSGGAKEPLDAALVAVLMQNIRVQGVFVGHRERFEAMCTELSQAKILPVIDQVFPFDQAGLAFERMRRGEHFGKIVVSVE
jgi:NADPH:quinone reductase-like Zn-dependent oxidoreductase